MQQSRPGMARPVARRPGAEKAAPPQWIRPQLTRLVDAAPAGDQWRHEIKLDGYRMHARLDHGAVRLLTRTGLDWTPNTLRPRRCSAPARLISTASCAAWARDGATSFSMIQLTSDSVNAAALVFFLFDLLSLH
jgi:bifunctional non-homologous end joining protein LigD